MTTKKRTAKRIYTLAAAIGLALGAMGIAGAATSGSSVDLTDQPTPAAIATAESASTDTEIEVPGDEDVDGVDHQFEGDEVGNNGDGNPDANETDEVESAETDEVETAGTDEVEASDDEGVDGVDHQEEGEHFGNNGDGIPDAEDATEALAGTDG